LRREKKKKLLVVLAAGLVIVSMLVSLMPLTVFAAALEPVETTEKAAPPPIIDDEEPAPAETTVKTAESEKTEAPATQAPAGSNNKTTFLIFLLIIFAFGAIAGYMVRGAIEKKRQIRCADISEEEAEQAYKDIDDAFYSQDKSAKKARQDAILAVAKPKNKSIVNLEEDDLMVDDESYILPTGKPKRLQDELEPAGIDYYNHPYYYDEDGMPYFHDPVSGDPVYYHELEEE
jgi:hypothetical protein